MPRTPIANAAAPFVHAAAIQVAGLCLCVLFSLLFFAGGGVEPVLSCFLHDLFVGEGRLWDGDWLAGVGCGRRGGKSLTVRLTWLFY